MKIISDLCWCLPVIGRFSPTSKNGHHLLVGQKTCLKLSQGLNIHRVILLCKRGFQAVREANCQVSSELTEVALRGNIATRTGKKITEIRKIWIFKIMKKRIAIFGRLIEKEGL